MSSRALRKLQGRDNELKTLAALADGSSEEEDVTEPNTELSSRGNIFTLLNESSSNDSEEDQKEVSTETINCATVPQELRESKAPTAGSKRKRRARKKQKNGEEKIADEEADIDQIIRDVERLGNNVHRNNPSSQASQKKPKYILTVEHRMLNPDTELRRIFGARTLMGDANYRHRNQAKASRGTWLTAPTPSWPRMSKTGLSMTCTENSQKYQYFAFEHSREYQQAQFSFLDAVDSSDHNRIAEVLRENNYHVDSLLTLSDVCRVNDDTPMARELLERALYCLERNFNSQFNLTTGTCRLPYRRQENRCLFLALYRHLHFVFQRGCSRTALELCKVLLNLDPDEDPLCVLLYIDFFALQAAEYNFLIELFSEWEMHKNLSQLPNISYSLAMAHFELSEAGDGDVSVADSLLQEALLKFPLVLMLLLEKCGVQPDQKISEHKYFTTEATQSSPDGLQLLCNLFVARNHTLWKRPEVLSWLERNVNVALRRVDDKDPVVSSFKTKRKKYRKPPLNIYRYAMVSELPGVISLLPPDIRLGEVLSHDPLPPPNTIVSYTRPERTRRGRSDNPLGLFFNSLLPSFDPSQEAQVADGAAGGGLADPVGLRDRVQVLMEAMRDMLGNFQVPENEQGQEEPDFNEDEWD